MKDIAVAILIVTSPIWILPVLLIMLICGGEIRFQFQSPLGSTQPTADKQEPSRLTPPRKRKGGSWSK